MKNSLASFIMYLLILIGFSPLSRAGQGYISPNLRLTQEFTFERIIIAPDLHLGNKTFLQDGIVLAKGEPIHHKIKRVLAIDGWHFFHLLAGVSIGHILNNEALQFLLYDWGIMPWYTTGPWLSPGRIEFISGSIALAWEIAEFWSVSRFNWDDYNRFYGGKAALNNGLDFAFHLLGTYLTNRNNILEIFLYTPRQGSYFVSVSIPIGVLYGAGSALSRPLPGGRL